MSLRGEFRFVDLCSDLFSIGLSLRDTDSINERHFGFNNKGLNSDKHIYTKTAKFLITRFTETFYGNGVTTSI